MARSKRKNSHEANKQSETETSKDIENVDASLGKKQTNPMPSIDVTVHRLRHLNYLPKHIVTVRATPDGSLIAISRENGSVELKAPNEKFRTIAEIAGFRKKLVNCLVWTCGIGHEEKNLRSRPTLVGGSRDGSLFVVDFQSGVFTGIMASGGGGIFALASLCQCRKGACSKENCSQLVAAGCEDGSTRIYQVIEYKKLELVSIVPSASGASVLSLSWKKLRNAPIGNKGCNGTVLFAGLADGTIRKYECVAKSASLIHQHEHYDNSLKPGPWSSNLRMTVESQGRNTPTRVWALQLLTDGTLISGDSLGHVQFWDGETGALLQSFDQNENKADVLDIAVATQEDKVFASGIDSRVVCIQRPTLETSLEGERKWILSHAQRPHTHDVKGLTICRRRITDTNGGENSLPIPVSGFHEQLCSGGLDTKLCTYFVEGFKKLRPKSLYPWPSFSPVAQAKDARVLIIRREEKIDLYKLDHQPSCPVKESYSVPDDETRIGTIELEGPCNLVSAAISDDGQYLAACDALCLYLFRLEYVADSEGLICTTIPTKMSLNTKFKSSIVSMKFGSNNQLIAATSDLSIHVIDMPTADGVDICTFGVTLKQKKRIAQHNAFLFPIQAIEFSKEKKWFVTSQGGYDCASVQLFSCEGDGKTYRHWWSVPDLEAPISAAKFTEIDGLPHLVVSCANFAFYLFDVKQRKLSLWSEKSGVPVSRHLPAELSGRNDYPVRIASNPAAPSKILLVSLQCQDCFDCSSQDGFTARCSFGRVSYCFNLQDGYLASPFSASFEVLEV